MLSRTLESAELNLPIDVIDIDVYPETASEFGVRSVPTLIMMDGNVEVKRMSGSKTTKELQEWAQND
jgi:thioredoxin-like negative regulator of GroEL